MASRNKDSMEASSVVDILPNDETPTPVGACSTAAKWPENVKVFRIESNEDPLRTRKSPFTDFSCRSSIANRRVPSESPPVLGLRRVTNWVSMVERLSPTFRKAVRTTLRIRIAKTQRRVMRKFQRSAQKRERVNLTIALRIETSKNGFL